MSNNNQQTKKQLTSYFIQFIAVFTSLIGLLTATYFAVTGKSTIAIIIAIISISILTGMSIYNQKKMKKRK